MKSGTTPAREEQPGKLALKVPFWTWFFVIACAAIPGYSLGGILPSLIGGLGLTACYAVCHEHKGARLKTWQQLLACAGITALAWALFGGLVWVVGSGAPRGRARTSSRSKYRVVREGGVVVYDSRLQSPAKRPLAEVDEAERRKIYRLALRGRAALEDAEAALNEAEAEGGLSLALEGKLEKRREAWEDQLEYVCDRFGLSRDDLRELLEQGDDEAWAD